MVTFDFNRFLTSSLGIDVCDLWITTENQAHWLEHFIHEIGYYNKKQFYCLY